VQCSAVQCSAMQFRGFEETDKKMRKRVNPNDEQVFGFRQIRQRKENMIFYK
jgi:hypothetical protein